ncbi:MAG: protein arginine kinase [Verrucomicrobiales bacterium]
MMRFSTLIRQPAAWMLPGGPHGDIVISSRIRVARNVADRPFPGWSKKEQRQEALAELQPRVEALPDMQDGFSADLGKLEATQKQVLVERHLISREQAAKGPGSAAVINRAQNLSIMINEEDHLRMQGILPGLDLKAAYALVDRVDVQLEQALSYAFHENLGFLTACPTNLGTGIRASAMLHLPGLVLSDQINRVIQAINRIGLAVRGLYGEGTEALAHLFQISNQSTLGQRESQIIAGLETVIEQIVQNERNARQKLLEDNPAKLRDHIGRAYGILRHAHTIESKESLNLLSMLRLGQDLGLLKPGNQLLIDHLLVEIQPAHLQLATKKKLDPEARDALRAELLRMHLRNLPEPEDTQENKGLTDPEAELP